MKPSASLSQKFLLVWGLSVAIALVLVGAVFSFLLNRYHQNAAEQALETSFQRIEAQLILRDDRTDALALDIAGHQDIISIVNLLNKYQDKTNYLPEIFDPEKEKLMNQLLNHSDSKGNTFVAIYTEDNEIVAYTQHNETSPDLAGIVSYQKGAPTYLSWQKDAGFEQVSKLPAIYSQIALSKIPDFMEHDYHLSTDALIYVASVPIMLETSNGDYKNIGTVIVADPLNKQFVAETSNLINHEFLIQRTGAPAISSSDVFPYIPDETFPGIFEDPGAFLAISNATSFIGATEIRISSDERIALLVGVDKQAFFTGIDALQKSILSVLALIAIVMLPLGIYYIRRNLTEPIKQLMSGIHALSGDGGDTAIKLNSRDELGTLAGAFNDMAQTIHEREEDIIASRDQLRLVSDNLPMLVCYVDSDQVYRFANRTCAQWYGCTVNDILGQSMQELHGSEYNKFTPHIVKVLSGTPLTFDENINYSDGITRLVRVSYVPHWSSPGEIAGFFALAEDITDIRKAADQLRQAQKMEAVGQLTGGVAHDFNNLLAIIMGNAEYLERKNIEGLQDVTADILNATRRGAELTQRLLAFSRQQPLRPQAIDLVELVSGISDMLTRTLGETISVKISAETGLWHAQADPGQVETALLNLAINARHAMPSGGNLLIECSKAHLDESAVEEHPEVLIGDYALLTITDNGVGMSEEIQDRAFEPFFTTKGVGEGSGLGLSMVYGFARQSGGHATIYSEPGHGTTVKIYLPRAQDTAKKATPATMDALPMGNGELILALEDDKDVGKIVVVMIESLGYRVTCVPTAEKAREALNNDEAVELLLADIVLPGGVSGPEFAAEAAQQRPDLKIIFMSGYSADAAAQNGILGPNSVLLSKPFEITKLAMALHDAFH